MRNEQKKELCRKYKREEIERTWYANHHGSDKIEDKKQNEIILNRGEENQKRLKTDSEGSGTGSV